MNSTRFLPWERLIVLAAVLLALSPTAHAYVDAGSGSFALQIAIAGALGALFSLKLQWRRVRRAIVSRFARGGVDDRRSGGVRADD
jgi:hypothetical protein